MTRWPSSTARLTMRPVILLPTTTSFPSTVPVRTRSLRARTLLPPYGQPDNNQQRQKDHSAFHAETSEIDCKPNN